MPKHTNELNQLQALISNKLTDIVNGIEDDNIQNKYSSEIQFLSKTIKQIIEQHRDGEDELYQEVLTQVHNLHHQVEEHCVEQVQVNLRHKLQKLPSTERSLEQLRAYQARNLFAPSSIPHSGREDDDSLSSSLH